jgi:glycosyltransferase involved in cell wall biosynthesis
LVTGAGGPAMSEEDKRIPLTVSVVIPVYNECRSVERETLKIHRFLERHFANSEILLVDDGSTDGSAAILDRLASSLDGVRLLRHPVNQGIGAAVMDGYRGASKEALTYFPADSQAEIEDIAEFASRMAEGVDVVLGYRSDRRDYSPVRLCYSYLNILLHGLLFGRFYRDVNWIHLVRRDALRRISVRSRSAFMAGEMLEKIRRTGGKIIEARSRYNPRREGRTNVGNFRGARAALADMLRLRWDLWIRPRSSLEAGIVKHGERA